MVLNRNYSYDWLIVSFHDYPLERDDDDDNDAEGHAYFHNIVEPQDGQNVATLCGKCCMIHWIGFQYSLVI